MVGIGIGEMIFIAGIALIVFGPEKFPDFAKIAMRTVRDLRGYMDDIQNEISKEIKPIKRELDQLSKYDPEKYIDTLTKTPLTGTAKSDAKPATATATATTAAADPTDRQDDSFDYGSADGAQHADADPYGHQEQDSRDGDTAESSEQPTQEEKHDDSASAQTAEAEDEFDFSKPPVEPMD